jgi:type II secretory pathway pseudopilin PulG
VGRQSPRRAPSTRTKAKDDPTRLGRLETVAAWLRLWTPPRAAVVPPVPWRRIALGALVSVAVLGAVAAYAIPRIDESKQRTAEAERRELAERQATRMREVIAEQRPVRGRIARPPGPELRARRELLASVEEAITADARRRAASGKLEGRAVRTDCVPAPSGIERVSAERDPRRRLDAYDCLAVTSDIPATKLHRAGALGHPFRAVVDFRRFTFVWCKTSPAPGEGAIPDPRTVPPLPRPCRRPRS